MPEGEAAACCRPPFGRLGQDEEESPEQRRKEAVRPPPLTGDYHISLSDEDCLRERRSGSDSDAGISQTSSGQMRRGSSGRSRSSRGVRFATPRSINDVCIISPATHPNRMGQFGSLWPRRPLLPGQREFSGVLGELAQVMLLGEGGQVVDWLDCRITACSPDGTYNVYVVPSAASRRHGLAERQGWGIAPTELRKKQPCWRSANCFAFCLLLGCALLLVSIAANAYLNERESQHVQLRMRLRRATVDTPLGVVLDTGMRVTEIAGDTPASAGGVAVGMRLLAIDGDPVRTRKETSEAMRMCGLVFTITVDIPTRVSAKGSIHTVTDAVGEPTQERRRVRYEVLHHADDGGSGGPGAGVMAALAAGLAGCLAAGFTIARHRRRTSDGTEAPCAYADSPKLPGCPVPPISDVLMGQVGLGKHDEDGGYHVVAVLEGGGSAAKVPEELEDACVLSSECAAPPPAASCAAEATSPSSESGL